MGGGSALFGANAVGGVINVITREPLRNTASLRQSYTSFQQNKGAYTSLMPTTSFNGSLVSEDRRAAAMIFGQHSSRGIVDVDGDDFTDIPELKNRALGFRAYYKTGIYGKLTAEYRSMHEYRRGGDRLSEAPFQLVSLSISSTSSMGEAYVSTRRLLRATTALVSMLRGRRSCVRATMVGVTMPMSS